MANLMLAFCKGQGSGNTSKYRPVSLSILMNTLTLRNESWSVSPCIIFKGAFICVWLEMKASYSLLTINQLSKTILLQSCSASLIWPLEYCPSVDENWSNMTSPLLICRYSDVGKLMPTAKSGCISLLLLYEFDISHTCTFCTTTLAAVVFCVYAVGLLKLKVCCWITELETLRKK